MIPATDFLERYYTDKEVAFLEDLRKLTDRIADEEKRGAVGRKALRHFWDDELTYIQKTHWLHKQKKPGPPQLLRLNYAQLAFYKLIEEARAQKIPIRIITLKARQLGFSSLIQSWQYEQCDREGNRCSLTLSYDEGSSIELFQKSRHLHDRMWFPRKTGRDSGAVLEMRGHNSTIFVKTSGNLSAGRGDTYHHLHGSEIPMWENAGETLVSAMQAVPEAPDTSVVLESTAKGAVGEFYDEWNKAERGENNFVPFFAPWFWDPEYSIGFAGEDAENAFGRSLDLTERRLQDQHKLTLAQLHWRRRTIKGKCQGSEAKFRQEYPSTAKEAFLTTGAPVFNAEGISNLERNVAPPLWRGNAHLEIA